MKMYNITLKYLEEIDKKEVKEDGMPGGVIYIANAKDILERFEVGLRQYLEENYLNTKNQEIRY